MRKVVIKYNNGNKLTYNNTSKIFLEECGNWLSVYYLDRKGFKVREIIPTNGILNITELSNDSEVPRRNY